VTERCGATASRRKRELGCDCEDCRAASSKYHRDRRRASMPAVKRSESLWEMYDGTPTMGEFKRLRESV
jgi:transposase InsO family protein